SVEDILHAGVAPDVATVPPDCRLAGLGLSQRVIYIERLVARTPRYARRCVAAGDSAVVAGGECVVTRFEGAVIVRVQRRQVTLGDKVLLAVAATTVVEYTPVERPVVSSVVTEHHGTPEMNLVEDVANLLIHPEDGTCLHTFLVVGQAHVSVSAVPTRAGVAGIVPVAGIGEVRPQPRPVVRPVMNPVAATGWAVAAKGCAVATKGCAGVPRA